MKEFLEKVDKTLRYHARQQVAAVRGFWWLFRHPRVRAPIFVIGCSRAGTTLVYKTLSESSHIGTLQRETHDLWVGLHPLEERNWSSHALSEVEASDRDRDFISRYFYTHTGKTRFVDKNNQNGLCVSYLQALFPDAYFVYVKRSPGDNINSLIEGWGKPGEFATWSDGLPDRVSIEKGKYNRWCFFIPAGWRDYLAASIEDVCAFQYRAINNAILEARKTVAPARWHEVFYEDIVSDPAAQFRDMFEACGLGFDKKLECHCRDVLNTPYNSFSEIRVDKWKDGRNREKIERVIPSVEAVARQMGY